MTLLGPYVVDGETLYIRRHGRDSAPSHLFRPDGRLWELLDASKKRISITVLHNDDPEGVQRLLGPTAVAQGG